jgi:hypothetical protein
MDNLNRLQLWYKQQCDGSWEHQHGVSVETLDNPGWTVVVDLVDTDLQSTQMEPVVEQKDEEDWLHCKIDNDRFVGNGGPLKLDAILQLFLDLIPPKSKHS